MSVNGNQNASKYSEEIVANIIELVSLGSNIVEACKANSVSYSTWCNWKRQNSSVLKLYTHARQDKAEYTEAMMDEVVSDLRDKKIDHSTARIIIDTLKWKMSKFYPKMFGADSRIVIEQETQVEKNQIVMFHIPDNGRGKN